MATKRPDLFYAYIGHSQIVTPMNDLPLYNKVYQMASKNKDSASLTLLNSIGKPPYEKAKKIGQLFKVVKKYERENSIAAPSSWFTLSTNYDNPKDDQNRNDGDDYSFVNYVGDTGLGVKSMRSEINFMKTNLDFKIPVYFIQGSEDLLTPKEITKIYFDKINAPKKKYYLLPKTAHGFNLAVLKKQFKIFKEINTSYQ